MASKYPQSPINQVRVAARKTGEELAATVNVSVGALRNMERGSQPVSIDMAERLFVAYGVTMESVTPKKGQAIYILSKLPYTHEDYLEWIQLTTLSDAKAKEMIELQSKRLRLLLEAAVIKGSLFNVDFQVNRTLDKIASQGQLDGFIRARLRQEGNDETWFNLDAGSVGVVEYVLARLEARKAKRKSKPA